MRKTKLAIVSVILIMLTGCSSTVINPNPRRVALEWHTPLGIVPMENNTQTPLAGEKVAAITEGVLQSKGANNMRIYHSRIACEKILACPTKHLSMHEICAWGRQHDLSYVMTGSVNEWSYKVGLDGEPGVNVSLKLINVNSGREIWSAVGSKTGGSRTSLGNAGQELINGMLDTLTIVSFKH